MASVLYGSRLAPHVTRKLLICNFSIRSALLSPFFFFTFRFLYLELSIVQVVAYLMCDSHLD
jgi:hypothetical protein